VQSSLHLSDIVLSESLLEIDDLENDSSSTIELESKFGSAIVKRYPPVLMREYSQAFGINSVF